MSTAEKSSKAPCWLALPTLDSFIALLVSLFTDCWRDLAPLLEDDRLGTVPDGAGYYATIVVVVFLSDLCCFATVFLFWKNGFTGPFTCVE